jgi:hypothetical protein
MTRDPLGIKHKISIFSKRFNLKQENTVQGMHLFRDIGRLENDYSSLIRKTEFA